MKLHLAVPILVVAGLLQTTLLAQLTVLNVKPDLVLLLAVTWGVVRGSHEGIGWGLVGGIVLDLLGGGPFGAATVALVVVAFLTSIGEFNMVRSSLLLPLTIMFGGTLLFYGLYLLLLEATGYVVDWEYAFRSTLLPASVVNTICTPLIYWLVQGLSERVRPAETSNW